MIKEQENVFIERAIKAHRTRCKKEGAIYDCPDNESEVINNDVVLRNARGVMAVYRIIGHAFSPASLQWVKPEKWPKNFRDIGEVVPDERRSIDERLADPTDPIHTQFEAQYRKMKEETGTKPLPPSAERI